MKGGEIKMHQGQEIVNPIQIQKFLSDIDYPCDKRELIDTAEAQGADENAMYTLEQLPEREYNSPNDVTEEIGNLT